MDISGFFNNFWATTGVTLIKVFAILVFGILLIKIIKRYMRKVFMTSSMESGLTSFLISVIDAVLYILLIFLVLSTLGVSMGAFIAAISAAGLAVALALQDSLSNLASGILILFNKPFVEGDYIKVGSEEGIVKSVRIFTTQIETYDKKVITLPNKTVVNSNVVNYTSSPLRRVTIEFCTPFDIDQEFIKTVVKDAFKDNTIALKSPTMFIGIDRYSEHGLVFAFKIWCKAEDYWDLYYDAYEKLTVALNDAGIKISNNESIIKFSAEEAQAKKAMYKKSVEARKLQTKRGKASPVPQESAEIITVPYEEKSPIESNKATATFIAPSQDNEAEADNKPKKKRKWLWGRDDE